MKYSRELKNLLYFEVYGYNVVVHRGRKYVRYDGLVLSSFRPIDVLCPDQLDRSLRVEGRRKYVLVGRSTSNPSIYLTSKDTIVYVYDRKELMRKLGKSYTIPERIRMRLSTLGNIEEGYSKLMWGEITDVVREYVDSSGVYPVTISLLLLYRSGKGGMGLKLFKFSVDEGGDIDLRWVKRMQYQFGYIFRGFGYVTVVSGFSRFVSYSEVFSAFSSVSRKGRKFEDMDSWFEDDEGSDFF